MFAILFLMFIVVPVLEIAIFVQVGSVIGLWPTVGLVLVSAFVGASLVRSQGLQTLMSVQKKIQQGVVPTEQIFEGVMLALAGILLITPGFLTDLMGMVLLLPAPRARLAKYVLSKAEFKVSGQGFSKGPFNGDGNTFEGEYEKKDDQDRDKLN
ncbi:FxsA family protein [Vibrio marisflavi]|uniref:Membrane protein FxsA n=1 Tax=Vibrio marisflavi CECT 7928 TaxID=634439 RepID=A0ABN8EB20_9VIBR|nr:FxsA family protein [Vibrio marisflavi]CAH0542795.1 hypothetical protein VMF7928_04209 [Vibrio marisflavi CECT 7928]